MDGLLGSLELEDPGDWPSSFPHLREIDQLLRCPICKEYFETAMVTSGCGHTFCSLCVRRCLTQETKCPSCRVVLTESDLRPSRIVDSLMRAFRSGRQALLSRLALDAADSGSTKEENIRKRQRIHTRSTTARKLGPVSSDADSVLVSNNETATVSADSDVADDNDSRIKVDEDSQDADYIDSDSDFASESRALQSKDSTVKCPSCQQMVPQSRINKHLDQCLNGHLDNTKTNIYTASSTSRKSSTPMFNLQTKRTAFILPRPTKLAYSLLSESKLRRTMKDLGISFKGDKSQMQARHVEWVNMYMANADSETPVSHRILLKRLSLWEESMSRQPDNPKNAQSQQQHLSNTSAIDHATKYADSFAQLVAQANVSQAKKADNLTLKPTDHL